MTAPLDFERIALRLYGQLILATAALENPGDLTPEEYANVIEDCAVLLDKIEEEVRAGWGGRDASH